MNIRILSVIFLMGYSYLSAMDSDDKVWKETFRVTEQQERETKFYVALCLNDENEVKKSIHAGTINPDKLLEWCSVEQDPAENAQQGDVGLYLVKDHIPVTRDVVRTNVEQYRKQKRTLRKYLPLAVAVKANAWGVVEYLVNICKVPIDTLNEDNVTTLHIAVNGYRADYVQFLLEHGANPQYKDGDGRTVLESIQYKISNCQKLNLNNTNVDDLRAMQVLVTNALHKKEYPVPHDIRRHLSARTIFVCSILGLACVALGKKLYDWYTKKEKPEDAGPHIHDDIEDAGQSNEQV